MTETNIFQLPAQRGTFRRFAHRSFAQRRASAPTDAMSGRGRGVAEFLAKHADLKTHDGRQRLVRHGHLPEREIATGIGTVAVRQPRVRDRRGRPLVLASAFSSAPTILPPYARRTEEPGGADPDPLPQGHLDWRLRGGAGRTRRQGCARPLGIDHRQAQRGVDRGACAVGPARPLGQTVRLLLGRWHSPGSSA